MNLPCVILTLLFGLLPSLPLMAGITQDSTLLNDTLAARQLQIDQQQFIDSEEYQLALEALTQAQQLYTKHQLWQSAIDCEIAMAKLGDYFDGAAIKVKHANRALQLANQYLPTDHFLNASAFRQKAEALMMQVQFDSANHFLNLAVPIFKNEADWSNLGWTEILIAVNSLNQLQLATSAQHLNEVNNLLTQKILTAEDQEEIQATLFDLRGVLYQLQGDYHRAIENTNEAIAININRSPLSQLDSSFIANLYNNLATFHLTKGDHPRALDNFLQVGRFDKNASGNPVLMYNIAQAQLRQKKYTQALTNFENCIALIGQQPKRHKLYAGVFNGLGLCYRELGELDQAEKYGRLALHQSSLNNKYIAQRLLANIHIKRDQANEALNLLQLAAHSLAKDTTAAKQRRASNQTIISFLKGQAHLLNRDTLQALQFFQQSLISNHSDFVDSLNLEANPTLHGIFEPIDFLRSLKAKAAVLSTYHGQPDNIEAALSTFQLCIQWIDTLQNSYVSEVSQLNWSSEFKPIYEGAIDVAYQRFQETNNAKYLDQLFNYFEKSKNAILLETLLSNEGKTQANIPDSITLKERDLNLDIAFYEKSIQESKAIKAEEKAKLYQQYLAQKHLELNHLKEQMEIEFPTFHSWKYGGEATSIATVQSKLINDKTALIEYFIGDRSTYVLAITKTTAFVFPLTSSATIKTSITNFREALLDTESFKQNPKVAFANFNAKAWSTYQLVLTKVIQKFPSDIANLIIIPDDFLNAIPFEALCTKENIEPAVDFALLPYLLYDYKIQYAYSANLLLNNRRQQDRLPANSNCLALAPTYQEDSNVPTQGKLNQLRNSGPLPGAANEIKSIAKYIEGSFDIGPSATEQKFKSQARNFGILHLAMHGATNMENANFNHLKFSDVQKDSLEDNILHHFEIANMKLGAQLVVLSACETGVGKHEKGEGVFSLARSFMYAGVPSVVMSLWKVSDASTSQLMPYFYDGLTSGQQKNTALNEAKKRFLQEANIEYRHPFYWSAFVGMGDEKKLKRSSMNFLWWGIAVMGCLLLAFGFWRFRKNFNAVR